MVAGYPRDLGRGGAAVIRLRRVSLPPGMNAVARRIANGDIEVLVSVAVTPAQQRAAVRQALRAFRRPGWRAGLLPLPLAAAWLRKAGRAARAHWPATAAAAAVVAGASAVLVAVVPHAKPPAGASGPASAGRVQASAPARTTPGAGRQSQPHSAPRTRPRSGKAAPVAGRPPGTSGPVTVSAPRPGTSAAPAPEPTASAPPASVATSAPPAPVATSTPAPTQTPAPTAEPSPGSGGGQGGCVSLLILRLCL